MASHKQSYHYKAFRLKINRVGKYPTSWSLKKLSKTGVHALSSPCRTTSLLVSKESDGWISYKSREVRRSLSRISPCLAIASPFLSLYEFFSFIPSFLLFFSFFSFLISPFFSFSLLICHFLSLFESLLNV